MGKPRTRILRAGIRASGNSLDDVHIPLWAGIEDKTQDLTFLQYILLLLRAMFSYPWLIWRFLRVQRPDLVLTSFPAVLDTVVLLPFARWRRVPVVCDLFISTYDTLVFDRGRLGATSIGARLIHWIERLAVKHADLVFMDTGAHARRIDQLFTLPEGSCRAVLVGVESEFFHSVPQAAVRSEEEGMRVLFYGQFIPLHGLETIVRAARRLRDEPVAWTLIGRGQEAKMIRRMLDQDPLDKVHWIDWVKYSELRGFIARADLCLGIFGSSAKAGSVIPNKVFQALASGRAIVTRDSDAIRELLVHDPPCVYLIRPEDPVALAEAVLAHMRRTTVSVCHSELEGRITAEAVGRGFTTLVAERLNLQRVVPL